MLLIVQVVKCKSNPKQSVLSQFPVPILLLPKYYKGYFIVVDIYFVGYSSFSQMPYYQQAISFHVDPFLIGLVK